MVEPVTEAQPLCPNTPYGVTKAAAEMMARAYNKCYDMDIIALRCCALYGPGQVMPEYVRDVIKAAYSGETLDMPKGYDQKFNLVYVTDVAQASVKACFTETRSEFAAYNITSGYQPTLGDIIEVVKEAVPDAQFNVGPGVIDGWDQHGFFSIFTETRSEFAAYNITSGYQPTLGDIIEVVKEAVPDAQFNVGPGVIDGWDQHGFFSIEAAKKDLGYEPQVSFEEGMQNYIDWLKENAF